MGHLIMDHMDVRRLIPTSGVVLFGTATGVVDIADNFLRKLSRLVLAGLVVGVRTILNNHSLQVFVIPVVTRLVWTWKKIVEPSGQ
jgi:uncharacterized membrane protein